MQNDTLPDISIVRVVTPRSVSRQWLGARGPKK